jgi:recombination protein RecR
MSYLPEPISTLAQMLGKLPGIGPRTAERLALHLSQRDPSAIQELANALVAARERIQLCSICGSLTEQSPCAVCTDSRRDVSLICVVEQPVDVLRLEKTGVFRGKYHVLGGKISPLDGVEPDDLRIADLENRLSKEAVREVVIALGSDVEGDATSHYLSKRLSGRGVKISRIAHGLPAGSGLEFADEITLSKALEGRRELD